MFHRDSRGYQGRFKKFQLGSWRSQERFRETQGVLGWFQAVCGEFKRRFRGSQMHFTGVLGGFMGVSTASGHFRGHFRLHEVPEGLRSI